MRLNSPRIAKGFGLMWSKQKNLYFYKKAVVTNSLFSFRTGHTTCMRYFLFLFIAAAITSCHSSRNAVVGTYGLQTSPRTYLKLVDNGRFEFVKNLSEPGPAFFPDSLELNFKTSGTWQMEKGRKVVLNSDISEKTPVGFSDAAATNPSLTSFSFYNEYGDPVAIRFMKFPPNKIKLYKGNSISFFAGDLTAADSLEFHFYGYRPVNWPAAFANNDTANHSHTITLYQDNRPGFFKDQVFYFRKNKIISRDRSIALHRDAAGRNEKQH